LPSCNIKPLSGKSFSGYVIRSRQNPGEHLPRLFTLACINARVTRAKASAVFFLLRFPSPYGVRPLAGVIIGGIAKYIALAPTNFARQSLAATKIISVLRLYFFALPPGVRTFLICAANSIAGANATASFSNRSKYSTIDNQCQWLIDIFFDNSQFSNLKSKIYKQKT